jgi:hypothetical protein
MKYTLFLRIVLNAYLWNLFGRKQVKQTTHNRDTTLWASKTDRPAVSIAQQYLHSFCKLVSIHSFECHIANVVFMLYRDTRRLFTATKAGRFLQLHVRCISFLDSTIESTIGSIAIQSAYLSLLGTTCRLASEDFEFCTDVWVDCCGFLPGDSFRRHDERLPPSERRARTDERSNTCWQ